MEICKLHRETEGASAEWSAVPASTFKLQQVYPESFREPDALVTSCEIKIHRVDVTTVRKLRHKTQRLRWVAPIAQDWKATATEAQQTTPLKAAPPLEGGELAGNHVTSLPAPELRVAELQAPVTATSASPPEGQLANANQTPIQVSGVAVPGETPPSSRASKHMWVIHDEPTLLQEEFDEFIRDGIRVRRLRPSFALEGVCPVVETTNSPAPPATLDEPLDIPTGDPPIGGVGPALIVLIRAPEA